MAAPPMLLREQASAFAGATLFITVDLNQGYWQMPLASNLQKLFTLFVTQKCLYTPHDGGSEPSLLANATGFEFPGIILVCDAERSIHADVNALRSDECNLVLPGNAGEDAR